ncbi:Copper binding protein, plastocyanin/azurin family [Thalassobacillus cyri]|uniref:Copper binding protein, plastocyanin/azurin family n=1 Tax=Thalassobacillus cyri TaxID=571932 RepID=A0A1H3VMY4_9BACI|nr:cupredoxin domain-containing protein [Thalassobacillus cyri]SDZ76146.1 Copper binding protein, plastocyanin/azurin family [Thalassobacillus cyri]
MRINRKGIYWIGSIIIAIGLLTGCSSNEKAAPEEEKQEEVKEANEAKKSDEQKAAQKEESSGMDQSPSKEEDDDHIIEISAFEMGYTPPEVTLQKGEEYTLIMENDGEIFHDLTNKKMNVEITYMSKMPDHPENVSFIDKVFGVNKVHAGGDHDGGHGDSHGGEPTNIHMNAKSGQQVKIKFIPKETGEFEFYCSIPGHEESGMHGNFNVE